MAEERRTRLQLRHEVVTLISQGRAIHLESVDGKRMGVDGKHDDIVAKFVSEGWIAWHDEL